MPMNPVTTRTQKYSIGTFIASFMIGSMSDNHSSQTPFDKA